MAEHFIPDVEDGRTDVLLHVLLLLLLSLCDEIDLAHPKFDIDRSVAEWPGLVESTNRVLTILNFLVEDVGILETRGIISLSCQLDRDDFTERSE